jgi:hypothetical protein
MPFSPDPGLITGLITGESELRARCLGAGTFWPVGLSLNVCATGAKDTSHYRLQRFQQLVEEELFCLERYYEAVPTFPSLFLRLSLQVAKRTGAALLMHETGGRGYASTISTHHEGWS